jgi:hypothetical protein
VEKDSKCIGLLAAMVLPQSCGEHRDAQSDLYSFETQGKWKFLSATPSLCFSVVNKRNFYVSVLLWLQQKLTFATKFII